jgi:hypothetical protein
MNKMDEFITTLWEGVWQSREYGSGVAYGKAYVKLPAQHTNSENLRNFKTDLLIVYSGMFRSGQTIVIPIKLQVDETVAVGYGEYKYNDVVSFKMLSSGPQQIMFQTRTVTENKITGIYESSTPQDSGMFTLTPSRTGVIPKAEQPSLGCIIC